MRNARIALAAVLAVLAAPTIAHAEDATLPRPVSGEVSIEVQNDRVHEADDATAEKNDLYATIEPTVVFRLNRGLSVVFGGTLEPVQDAGPREDRVFEDHGGYVSDLYIKWENGPFAAKAGKFTPNFGIAWDAAPGIYGSDIAEDNYEFGERIGIEGAYTFDAGDSGKHSVSASTFFLDTTVLYHSVGRGRAPHTLGSEDGGISNSEDFSSFAVALDGAEIKALPGFRYHLAWTSQDKGRGGAKDQRGFAIGAEYAVGFGEGLSLTPIAEYVRFWNADAVADQDRTVLTAGARIGWKAWNLAVVYAGTDTDPSGGSKVENHRFQISAGYEFPFGLSADVGWMVDETDNLETRTLGFLLAYKVEF